MTEQGFWDIINSSLVQHPSGSEGQYQEIAQALASLPEEELIQFENHLAKQKNNAFSFPVLMANFILQSYINDDIFEDFRLWLISFGQEKFSNILDNADNLASFSNVKDPIEDITGEGLVFAAQEAYEAATGKEDFLKRVRTLPDPEMNYLWPEDIDALAKMLPNLFNKYWDNSRTYELGPAEE
ncbi:DUF4240 domain-containing protein [Oceanospirillum maris]|jgi:hypothetical protein|uniref:DUF4240 domain-containing protein n=1 Tax=Oceanospirillum maris TaxID=64977 RepID=UPI000412A727|nr:DUF4240 domain-containing protein [Oceanospirillum maris]